MIRAGTTGSERVGFDAEAASRAEQSLVIARQTDRLAVTPEELQGGKMQGVGRAHRRGKGLEGASQDRCGQLEQRHTPKKRPNHVPVRGAEAARVNAGPQLILTSSSKSTLSDVTGARGGIPDPGISGGVSQPWRTTSARRASATAGARSARGGTSSATTRSRSVTRTISPLAARRTYSLRRFFRILRPTARTQSW